MDRGNDRLQTVGEGPSGNEQDGPGPARPSLLVAAGLTAGIVLVVVLVSRPAPTPPESTLATPTLPEVSVPTTTSVPVVRTAFEEASALTWSPVSGLATITDITDVIRHGGAWFLLGQDADGSRVARSSDGITWETVDTPTGPDGGPVHLSGLASTGLRLVAVGKVNADRGEVAAVWWATGDWDIDAPAWNLEVLPIESFDDTPDDALSFLDVSPPVAVDQGVVVVVHEVISNLPTSRDDGNPLPPNGERLPDAWIEAVAGGGSIGSSSTNLTLSVGGFVTDVLTWAEVDLTPYQRSRTITWVASVGEVPIQVIQDPAARIVPVGNRDDDTIFGIENGNTIVTSRTGVTWEREATVSGLSATEDLAWVDNAWLRILDDAVLRSEDTQTWEPITPQDFLGTEPWYLDDLATSDLGSAALAVRPRFTFPPPVTVTGTDNERVVIDLGNGVLTVEPADGLVITRELGDYLFGRGGTEIDGDEVVLVDTDSQGELARIPLGRWLNAWNQEPSLPLTEIAIVHSVDGTTWSARSVSEVAGILADGASGIFLTDEFALLDVDGEGPVPPVWVGFLRGGDGPG